MLLKSPTTTTRCVATLGCNQRGTIALGNMGTAVMMSARYHNPTSCHNLRMLSRESLVPHSPKTLPQRSGKFSETPCIHRAALAPFGENSSNTHDLFDAEWTEMGLVVEVKGTALIEYKQSPSEMNLHIKAATSKVQQTVRRCQNENWTQLSQEMQTAATTVNIRGVYDDTLGRTNSKTAPIKSYKGETITDKRPAGGWNTILTSITERTPCLTQPTMSSNACPPWMR